MPHTPASFTKNFAWNESFKKLLQSISDGFGGATDPISRDTWRKQSGINNKNLELIPLNFFLYSKKGIHDDFVMADTLVERAVVGRYDSSFANLALFALHLARAGDWHGSKWPDGRVAGWVNLFIVEHAWRGGDWRNDAFGHRAMSEFLDDHVDGEARTKRKMLTNYRFMLRSAGVLVEERLSPKALHEPWLLQATQLFWDRELFDGHITPSADAKLLERIFYEKKIQKLLRCTEQEARPIIMAACRQYSAGRLAQRASQLERLRPALLAAA
jgi:hypothetical protein